MIAVNTACHLILGGERPSVAASSWRGMARGGAGRAAPPNSRMMERGLCPAVAIQVSTASRPPLRR
eukprot:7497372-Pyramimonas_sp.AAC.1